MPFENTGLIIGQRGSSLLLSPASAYVIAAKCNYGCSEAFFVGGPVWCDDVDEATIFRSYEGAEAMKASARDGCKGCLREQGVTFDIKPLAGYIKP